MVERARSVRRSLPRHVAAAAAPLRLQLRRQGPHRVHQLYNELLLGADFALMRLHLVAQAAQQGGELTAIAGAVNGAVAGWRCPDIGAQVFLRHFGVDQVAREGETKRQSRLTVASQRSAPEILK